MDLFSTHALNRVVEELPANPAFLLNAFFPTVEVSDSETIMFDHVKGARRIAPFVAPTVAGKVILEAGYETESFRPAYIKDKRVFNPDKQFKRRAGEKIGGSLTPEQRLAGAVAWALSDQLDMWVRRLEVMAAEVLTTGKLVIKGENYPEKVVDFRRDPALTITLTGLDKWDVEGVDPVDDLEEWSQTVYEKSFIRPTDAVMDMHVWKVVRGKLAEIDNETGLPTAAALMMKARLNTDVRALDEAKVKLGPLVIGGEGAVLVAIFTSGSGTLRLWAYNDAHVDPETGIEVSNLPAGTVLLLSTGIEGVRHFGAIKDLKAGLQPRQYFVKSWEEEDPSERYMLGQSAPLLVPYRKNASLSAKVL
ncbi:major capsid protein [Methylobacterium sp. WCS2018Hpa-22]|uniref:major capsid protein n=1 Tax=Methylobacterium sp. WCS2018Hpa-22 TaxID=3073633 RepID=UPI00288B422C|nr:major capsid protein [Methylobacterium sp. WCS2018Hpa-22]